MAKVHSAVVALLLVIGSVLAFTPATVNASQVAAAAPKSSAPAKVWVNSSSKVYHCPGTRYYGNTKRGEYLTETEAVTKGFRAAYGKRCGTADLSAVNGGIAPNAPMSLKGSTDAGTKSAVDPTVWVNTSSKVYHCAGTRYYGTTKRGSYMKQSEADRAGHRPAYGKVCG